MEEQIDSQGVQLQNIPFSISNNDATECYINSSLQCLFCVPELLNLLCEMEESGVLKDLKKIKQNDFYEYILLKKLMVIIVNLGYYNQSHNCKQLLNDDVDNCPILNPENFKQIVKRSFGDNSNLFTGQQCAFEFIKKVLNKINSFLKKYFQISTIEKLFGSRKNNISICTHCCNFNRTTEFSEIQSICLDLCTNINKIKNISDLIEKYFKQETVNDWCCYLCKNDGCLKDFYFETYPIYLLICLKRFNNKLKKNCDPIFIKQNIIIPQSAKYELISIIIHIGKTIRSGHYISIVKKNNNFYIVNDEVITFLGNMNDEKLNDQQYVLNNSYVLLYHRV